MHITKILLTLAISATMGVAAAADIPTQTFNHTHAIGQFNGSSGRPLRHVNWTHRRLSQSRG